MHIVILGNGISGITTARFLRKLSACKITVISAETDYFFSRTALMYVYMGHMQYSHTKPYEDTFWEKNKITLIRGFVNRIDFESKELLFDQNRVLETEFDPPPKSIQYDKLVLALGSASNKFGWPGQDLAGVKGLYSYQDLTYLEKETKRISKAVVVGGGLIGIELAEMLHSRHIPVTMLVREASYWNNVLPAEESQMIGKHIKEHGIDLRLQTELASIEDDGHGRCKSIITKQGEEIQCQFVGLTAGVHPNVKWLMDGPLKINRGILVDNKLATNIEDVFAIGDCAELIDPRQGRRPIEAIWYSGRMMGETLAYHLTGHDVSYDPGIWFNSAKFLDIEYQVYGEVPAILPDYVESLYWQDQQKNVSIRINYHNSSKAVIGFNLFGVRFRHEVCEKWIREKANIEQVLQQLSLADFSPEFYSNYSNGIIECYNKKENTNIQLRSRRSLKNVLSFLSS